MSTAPEQAISAPLSSAETFFSVCFVQITTDASKTLTWRADRDYVLAWVVGNGPFLLSSGPTPTWATFTATSHTALPADVITAAFAAQLTAWPVGYPVRSGETIYFQGGAASNLSAQLLLSPRV